MGAPRSRVRARQGPRVVDRLPPWCLQGDARRPRSGLAGVREGEMSEPEVSVIIPTRNRWPMLSTHALPSALAQQEVDIEIVVVDDASEDDTVARVEAIADPRVRVVRNE